MPERKAVVGGVREPAGSGCGSSPLLRIKMGLLMALFLTTPAIEVLKNVWQKGWGMMKAHEEGWVCCGSVFVGVDNKLDNEQKECPTTRHRWTKLILLLHQGSWVRGPAQLSGVVPVPQVFVEAVLQDLCSGGEGLRTLHPGMGECILRNQYQRHG